MQKCVDFLFIFDSKYFTMSITSEQVERLIKSVQNAKVGGVTSIHKITGAQLGVSGAAYASGDVLGDLSPIEIPNFVRNAGGTGLVQSLVINDLSNQSGAIDVVFFDSEPTATTFTDNSALDIADADLPKVIAVVSVTSANYKAFADNCVAILSAIGFPIQSLDNNSIWICPVSRDAKTYVADELSLTIGVLND